MVWGISGWRNSRSVRFAFIYIYAVVRGGGAACARPYQAVVAHTGRSVREYDSFVHAQTVTAAHFELGLVVMSNAQTETAAWSSNSICVVPAGYPKPAIPY